MRDAKHEACGSEATYNVSAKHVGRGSKATENVAFGVAISQRSERINRPVFSNTTNPLGTNFQFMPNPNPNPNQLS